MDKKLTDNEIVKGLEICSNNGECKECPINPHHGNYGYCTSLAIKAALDLINRLQVKNQRLTTAHPKTIESIKKMRDKAKAEAYKEFAERLKKKYKPYVILGSEVAEIEIDNLLKELAGENNETKTF